MLRCADSQTVANVSNTQYCKGEGPIILWHISNSLLCNTAWDIAGGLSLQDVNCMHGSNHTKQTIQCHFKVTWPTYNYLFIAVIAGIPTEIRDKIYSYHYLSEEPMQSDNCVTDSLCNLSTVKFQTHFHVSNECLLANTT